MELHICTIVPVEPDFLCCWLSIGRITGELAIIVSFKCFSVDVWSGVKASIAQYYSVSQLLFCLSFKYLNAYSSSNSINPNSVFIKSQKSSSQSSLSFVLCDSAFFINRSLSIILWHLDLHNRLNHTKVGVFQISNIVNKINHHWILNHEQKKGQALHRFQFSVSGAIVNRFHSISHCGKKSVVWCIYFLVSGDFPKDIIFHIFFPFFVYKFEENSQSSIL